MSTIRIKLYCTTAENQLPLRDFSIFLWDIDTLYESALLLAEHNLELSYLRGYGIYTRNRRKPQSEINISNLKMGSFEIDLMIRIAEVAALIGLIKTITEMIKTITEILEKRRDWDADQERKVLENEKLRQELKKGQYDEEMIEKYIDFKDKASKRLSFNSIQVEKSEVMEEKDGKDE